MASMLALVHQLLLCFSGGCVVKHLPTNAGDAGDMGLIPGSGRSPEDGWSSMVGCSPWGREESDTTERLPFHFSLACIGEGTHSSVLAWRIPGTREPGGLPSIGLHRVGHD